MTNPSHQGQLISKEMEWFLHTLRKDYGVRITAQEVGTEGVMLGTDEVDAAFVPHEVFAIMPSNLLYELLVTEDQQRSIWCGAVVFYPDSSDWCLQILTKNDEVVLRRPLTIQDCDSR